MSDWTIHGVARMLELISSQHLTALFQVIMIDLVLAGDNAIVIGLAAAGLPEGQRKKAILIGILAATILRIGFASVTVQLLQIIGLLLAGGVLLLWVCWKMWRELRTSHHHQPTFQSLSSASTIDASATAGRQKTLGQAVWQITLADVSMSLDNVLAVAGAAREHPMILIFGLAPTLSPACWKSTAGSPMSASRSSSMWLSTCAIAALWRCGRTSTFSRSPTRPSPNN
jgi:YjbE family integral membrane protein